MAKFDMIIQAKTLGQAGIKRMGNSMQGLQGRLKNVRMAALSVNTAFKAMAVILTAGAVTRFAKGAINQADAFGKLSRQTGIAANTLQSYVNAGKLAGVEQTTIEKSLRRLAQSQREADQGIKTYTDSYEALGINVRDSNGNLKSSEILLGDIAEEFKGMQNGATKAAIAMEIFGRSGSQLIPLLNEGREELEKWNYQTSEEFSQNAEYFNDQLTMLGFGFDGFRKQLADELLPALNSIMEAFRELFSTENDWEGLFEVIGVGVRILSFGLLSSVVAIEEIGNTLTFYIKRLNQFRKGDFKGMDQSMLDGQKRFGDRYKRNKGLFDAIIGGEAKAPKSYFEEGTEEVNLLDTQLNKTFGGAMQAKIKSFAETIKNVGSQVGDVVVKSFKSMEDSLVTFVRTGTLSFKKLADSIINDMIRIAIRQAIIAPILGGFGDIFSKSTKKIGPKLPATPRASGGPVSSGSPYLVGEKGPEIFIPNKSGKIAPNSSIGNTVINVSVNAQGTEVQGNEAQGQSLGRVIASAIQVELSKQSRPGGILSPA